MKKKVTISQVAEQAGVSKTTISRFLNGQYGNMSQETKERIASVIATLNYRPNRQAQALKSKRSYLIGVVVADISNMYSSLLLKGIGTILEKNQYQMIIMDAANSVKQEHELLEKLIDQGVEAIILQPSSRNAENYQFIQEYHIPLLLVDRQTEPAIWPLVTTNNEETVKEILEKALQKNYHDVVVVSEPLQDVMTREIRYQTVKQMTEKMGKAHQLLEVEQTTNMKAKVLELVADTNYHLLFASNGRVLMELLTILIEEKINIPEQIGVTGFDDWNLTALVGPGITSIEQQSQQIGEVAAEEIIHFLTLGNELPAEVIVPSKVQWRYSV
ncbi:LacI family DNA-binding transcriptional regulator [Enterococcus saccharolyticus]|uniref:LacI family transcriptional regulator n=1 Tax=Candidatus Enterococcus willemsii TaxID=1857215 RepID=A0ABQ6Z278_9ENTE|nr:MULTISPECIES: LacI family DNA-binding transcriptional regulator [Enterococcus]KAF1305403.1 hypothetical protein BAU17_02620 [Enterococcus sp. CU12B]MCD5001048.1 LacI family DNA-binding transcriptional regulator [Enterococcus saccharolyticus]